MEIPLASFTSNSTTSLTSTSLRVELSRHFSASLRDRGFLRPGYARIIRSVKASAERTTSTSDAINKTDRDFATGGAVMEVTSLNRGFADLDSSSHFPVWDKIGAIVRLSYGIG